MKRTNLVLVFVCAVCGEKLAMGHEIESPVSMPPDQEPQLPTGAVCLTVGVVQVEPCEVCVGALRAAAIQITRGLRKLAKEGGR